MSLLLAVTHALAVTVRGEAPPDSWVTRTWKFVPRNQLAAVTIGSQVYLIGGYNYDDGALSLVERWDTPTGSPTRVAPMLHSRKNHAAVALDGQIYVIGGECNGVDVSSSVERYDPISNSWSELAPLAVGRTHLGAAALDGAIYAIGGAHNGDSVGTVERYNPTTDTWVQVSSLPSPHDGFGIRAAATGGKIYAVGGYASNQVDEYTPSSDTWTPKSGMEVARESFGLAVLNGKLYAVGGSDGEGFTQVDAEAYDPIVDQWEALGFLSEPRTQLAAVALGNSIVALGGVGEDGETFSTTVDRFIPPGPSSSWFAAPLPVGRAYSAATVASGKVYVVGGYNDGNLASEAPLSSIEVYDPPSDTWRPGSSSMHTARTSAAAASYNGRVFAFGGVDANGQELDSLEEYDPTSGLWSDRMPMHVARGYLASAVLDGKIYAIGGNSDAVEAYDPEINAWVAKAALPLDNLDLPAAVVGGKIYALAHSAESPTGSLALLQYNPDQDSWSTRTPPPVLCDSAAAAALAGKLYLVTPAECGGGASRTYEYDPAANTWTVRAPLNFSRTGGMAVVSLNGRLYVLDGDKPGLSYNVSAPVEEYSPVLSMSVGFGSPLTENRSLVSTFSKGVDYRSFGTGGTSGAGEAGGGRGIITVNGVDGSILRAFLYWHGIDRGSLEGGDGVYENPRIRLRKANPADPLYNPTLERSFTGELIGVGTDNCQGGGSLPNAAAYRADVTSFIDPVNANGTYEVLDLASQAGDSANGASLILFYDDGDPTNNRNVRVFEGLDANDPKNAPWDAYGWNLLVSDWPYLHDPVDTAFVELHVADGETTSDGPVQFRDVATGTDKSFVDTVDSAGHPTLDGLSVPNSGTTREDNQNPPEGYWDINRYLVSPMFGARPHLPFGSIFQLQQSRIVDCLSLIVAVMDEPYRERYCGNGYVDAPDETCDDGNTTDSDGCSALCKTEARCGDGTLNEEDEECDDGNVLSGDCCSSTCKTEPKTTLCRPSIDQCDAAEFCDGVSGQCPPDAVKESTEMCGEHGGACDPLFRCDGVSKACPPDPVPPSGVGAPPTCNPRKGRPRGHLDAHGMPRSGGRDNSPSVRGMATDSDGICALRLERATNLQIDKPSPGSGEFQPGAKSVEFSVGVQDSVLTTGEGTLVVTNAAGKECTVEITPYAKPGWRRLPKRTGAGRRIVRER